VCEVNQTLSLCRRHHSPETWIKSLEVDHIKVFNFQRLTKGETHIEEREGHLKALARSLRRRHKIKNKKKIGSPREEARQGSRGGGSPLAITV
jgi:hypothetical protein